MKKFMCWVVALLVLSGCGTPNPYWQGLQQAGGAGGGAYAGYTLCGHYKVLCGVVGGLIGLETVKAFQWDPSSQQYVQTIYMGQPQGYYQGGGGGGGCGCCGVDRGFDGGDEYGGWCSNRGAAVLRHGEMSTPSGKVVCPATCYQSNRGSPPVTMIMPANAPRTVTRSENGFTVDNYLRPGMVDRDCQTGSRHEDGRCLINRVPDLIKLQTQCDNGVKDDRCALKPAKYAEAYLVLGNKLLDQ